MKGEHTIGVPGMFTPEESKGYMRLGFHTFRGNKKDIGPGSAGYWLKEI